ncbi:MAG: hypothetical protein M3Y93_04660 [Pseudomonadota bacterium]|nr:hypothetical protein [Pseudomonadota bacterium]
MNITLTQRPTSRNRSTQAGIRSLVRRAVKLRGLYLHAADVSEPGLRVILRENAGTLALLVVDLQAQLHSIGIKISAQGRWRGSTRRQLSTWLLHAMPKNGIAWIRLLAHHESALLQAFEQAIVDASPELALALRRQLPRLHGIHLDMDCLTGTARH